MDVENFHSVVHHKAPPCTVLDYARNFGNVVKEGLKRTTTWAAFYYTNPKSWYPVPDRSISFYNIPLMPHLPPKTMISPDIKTMRDWAQAYGDRRRETTMSKAGTLPGYLYDKEIQPSGKIALESGYNIPKEGDSISEAGTIASVTKLAEEEVDEATEIQDDPPTFEASEFDSSSDEEPEEDLATGSTGIENDAGLLALAPEANFLLGAVSGELSVLITESLFDETTLNNPNKLE